MRGNIVSELRLAALYANQVAHAIVRMDDRLSNFFNAMRSTHNTFVIDVLGTPGVVRACNLCVQAINYLESLQKNCNNLWCTHKLKPSFNILRRVCHVLNVCS